MNQIVELSEISNECQGVVSPSTEVILECTRCYLAGSLGEVEGELTRAAETIKICSYSDQLLINFFEVLIQYKNAERNPNGEGVMEYFMYMADNMLLMIKDPLLRGFVLGLKGMIESLAEGRANSIKMAMLLSPAAAKGLLTQGI